jgi:hypothetical protein
MFSKFWKETKGGLSVGFLGLLTPILAMSMATTETTSYSGVMTRIHQSETAALVFVAKHAVDVENNDERDQLLYNWMDINLELSAVQRDDGDDGQVIDEGQEDSGKTNQVAEVTYRYRPKSFFKNLMGNIFVENDSMFHKVKTERIRLPLEIVFSMDASSSAGSCSAGGACDVVPFIKTAIETIFRNEEELTDTRISLISHNFTPSFPLKYADKLVKPSSRKLYKGTTDAELQRYEKLKEILRYNNLSENNLLDENFPGVSVHQISLLRKPLKRGSSINKPQTYGANWASDDDIRYYAEHADDPIEDLETDGFELADFDGIIYPMAANWAVAYFTSTVTTPATFANAAEHVLNINRDQCILKNCPRDPDLFKYFLISPDLANKISIRDRFSLQIDGGYGFAYLKTLNSDQMISVIGQQTASLPILAGSNRKQELLDHMKYWPAGIVRTKMLTSNDEAMLWSLRLLSPNYSNIWGIDNYPAPFHSGVDKRFFFNVGSPSGGYNVPLDSSTDPKGSAVIREMCRVMQEKGIEIYFVAGELSAGYMSGYAITKAVEDCIQGNTDRMTKGYISTNTELMNTWLKRKYKVQLSRS